MIELTKNRNFSLFLIVNFLNGNNLVANAGFVNDTLRAGCQMFEITKRFEWNLPFIAYLLKHIKFVPMQSNQFNPKIPLLLRSSQLRKTERMRPKNPSNQPAGRDSVKPAQEVECVANKWWPADGPAGEEQISVWLATGGDGFKVSTAEDLCGWPNWSILQ